MTNLNMYLDRRWCMISREWFENDSRMVRERLGKVRYFAALLTLLFTIGVGNVWGAVTFTAGTDKGSTTNTSSDSMDKSGITISSTSAGLAYDQYRFYSGTITISSIVGNITSVVFTATTTDYATVLGDATASDGSISASSTTATWTGDASSFTLTITAQSRVSSIVVTYTSSGSGGGGSDVTDGDVFTRISNASDLADGDQIIFVNQAETYACSTTQNSNNRGTSAITTSSHTYTYDSEDAVQVFTVKISSSNSSYYGFHTGSGYLASKDGNSNKITTNSTAASTDPSGAYAWTISASSSVFTVLNVTNSTYYLAFNGTTIFSKYASSMTKPYIYKKNPSEPCDDNPTIGTASLNGAVNWT